MKDTSQLLKESVALSMLPGTGVYEDVAAERLRAARKHQAGSVELARADDHARWWPVVIEEIGEVARAFQESPQHLYTELVQAAAMLCAWADAAKAALEDRCEQ